MKLMVTLILSVLALLGFGQNQGNIWYFGFGAGLDFNSGNPVVITDGQTGGAVSHIEGTSVISDSTGNLLFYTDGEKVWNKNHELMPNGSGLMGLYSSTQSALIVPAPIDPDRYFYIFTVGDGTPDPMYQHKAHYSIVDMCLDNGKGDVLPDQKNILLGDTLPEKLIATRHSNGVDYWILTHKYFTDEFWAFKLTSAGVTDTIISHSGSVYGTNMVASFGQMKFSPDGSMLALGTHNILTLLELHDFDNSTGIVSNARDLFAPNDDQFHTYGIEFSPDNSKLYVNGRSSSGILKTILAQYDLTAGGGNLVDINASLYIIFDDEIGLLGGHAMQLGPNGVIYMPSQDDVGYLSTINTPNSQGIGCNYQDSSIYLLGKSASFGMPSFVSNFDYSNTIIKCDPSNSNILEDKISIAFYPNPTKDFLKVDIYDFQEGEYQIELVDILTNTILFSQKIDHSSNVVDLTFFQSGIYFALIKYDGIVICAEKIIKK